MMKTLIALALLVTFCFADVNSDCQKMCKQGNVIVSSCYRNCQQSYSNKNSDDSRLQEYKFSSPNIVGGNKRPGAYIENGPPAATEPEWDTSDPTPPEQGCVDKCRADGSIHTPDDFKRCWHRCPRMKLSFCEKRCLNNSGRLNDFGCIDRCKVNFPDEEAESVATSAPPKKALEHVVVKVAPKKKK